VGTIGFVDYPGPGTVTNSGTSGSAVLDFVLVRGPQGAIGDLTAAAPLRYVGSEFGLNVGTGLETAGTTLAVTYGTVAAALGTTTAGTVNRAARQDHVHALPTAADIGAVANALISGSKGSLISSNGTAVTALAVGSNDTLLVADSAQSTGLKWASLTASQIPTLTSDKVPTLTRSVQTGSYTLVLADAGDLVEMESGSAQTLTIPTNASVAFPVGTKIDVLQTGAGECSIAPVDGTVTLNSEGSKRKINAQWQAVTLIKRDTNSWALIGAIKT
jgi:hypothetical protein